MAQGLFDADVERRLRLLEDLDTIAQNVAFTSRYGAVPGAWIPVTVFSGTWVNFGTPYQAAQYRITGDTVEMRGLIKNGTSGTAAFTLPAGFRPPADCIYAQNSGGGYALVTITSAGVVTPTGVSVASLSLNVSFSTAT